LACKRIILTGASRGGGRNWLDLAQERDLWQAFVNVVMNLQVPWWEFKL
jgi:hypothetical protein